MLYLGTHSNFAYSKLPHGTSRDASRYNCFTCCFPRKSITAPPIEHNRRTSVRAKSSQLSRSLEADEDLFRLFYKVSDYDCYRISDSPLLRDHIGLFTYRLSDFEGDGYEIQLSQEKLDIINDIDVYHKHVSLLNIGTINSHSCNQGWIKVLDAFRSGGAMSVSYQFREISTVHDELSNI